MMHEIEQINKLLDEVGKRNAIELKLNHEGTGGLQLKSGVQLYFEYIKGKGRLYIYTPVMPVPPDEGRRLALYEAMLDCNFLNLGCETGGLAVFRHTGQAVYQTGLEVKSLNADRLHRRAVHFSSCAVKQFHAAWASQPNVCREAYIC